MEVSATAAISGLTEINRGNLQQLGSFNKYYERLADRALLQQGLTADYENAIKHSTASSHLTSIIGPTAAFAAGMVLDIWQYITGHDTIDESFKDQFNNQIGREAERFLTEKFGKLSASDFASAMALLAKEGLLARTPEEAKAINQKFGTLENYLNHLKDTIDTNSQKLQKDFQDNDLWLPTIVWDPTDRSGNPFPGTAPRDPLIIDLDGDGLELVGISQGAYFDGDGDGILERTGWVGKDDGLLVRDTNADGKVGSGLELFGSTTEDGFTALAKEDTNLDGKINSADAIWQTLRVWKDLDGDGSTDAGELLSLDSLGISEISLTREPAFANVNGNTIAFLGSASGVSGVRQVGAAFLQTSTFDTKSAETLSSLEAAGVTIPADVLKLPYLKGYGKLGDFAVALTRDAALLNLVKQLVLTANTDTGLSIRNKFEDILLKWAGVDSANPTATGDFIDARHVLFVEKVIGQALFSRTADGVISRVIPSQLEGWNVEQLYDYWVDHFFVRFGSQLAASETLFSSSPFDTALNSSFIPLGFVQYDTLTGRIALDTNVILSMVAQQAPLDRREAVKYFEKVMPFFASIAAVNDPLGSEIAGITLSNFADRVRAAFATLSDAALTAFAIDRVGTDQFQWPVRDGPIYQVHQTVFGTSGSDVLSDPLDRGMSFVGGVGNDTITGGRAGDDYVYVKGDGDDTISESGSGTGRNDRLLLVGINPQDLQITASGSNVVMSVAGPQGGSVTLVNQLTSPGRGIEEIIFADGTRFTAADISSAVLRNASTIGNDVINGFGFDEVIAGGTGDDIINAGGGNDTYIYRAGDGNDIITLASAADFEALSLIGIRPTDVALKRTTVGSATTLDLPPMSGPGRMLVHVASVF